MRLRSGLLPALLAAALAGCTLAPTYVRPGLPVGQNWPQATPLAPAGAMAGDLAWRDVFEDPRLQGVIDLALKQNRDLRVAVGNIERARAQYRVQRAALLPAINAVGSESKIHTPLSTSTVGQAYTDRRLRRERRHHRLRARPVRPRAQPDPGRRAELLRRRREPPRPPRSA